MFVNKQNTLLSPEKVSEKSTETRTSNTFGFIDAGLKKSAETLSGNGSLKYSTTGNPFVDQFGSMSRYKAPRPYSEIADDMVKIYSNNPYLAVCFVFFLRMITRVVSLFNGVKTEKTQKGAGLRHEGIVRMIWLHMNHKDVFWKNISLFISVGSWKDIFQMLSYDLQFNNWNNKQLDWDQFGKLILAGLENPNSSEMVKKYLPQIKSRSKCTTLESQADTIIAKWICSLLFGKKENSYSYKQYRKLKTSGTAHQWQQLISQGKHNLVNFDTVHGRALSLMVSSRYIDKNGLADKYEKWISAKPAAKFTGFVYELSEKVSRKLKTYQVDTINAQYNTLLELAKTNTKNSPFRPISVLDGSASMGSPMYIGNGKVGKMNSINVAWANLVLLDDMMVDGPFKGHYLQFSNKCEMMPIHGKTFTEKILTNDKRGAGGTNFMSVFKLIIDIKKKNPSLTEEQFPNMIVCFSDGEFNGVSHDITNVEAGRKALSDAGFSKEYSESFGFCFVDMPNTFYYKTPEPKFETFGNVKNCFYFSGYDLAPLGFLFGSGDVITDSNKTPSTAEELFMAAMNQEIMQKIEI